MSRISPQYLDLQVKLHNNPNYGVASIAIAPAVKDFFEAGKFLVPRVIGLCPQC